MMKINSNLQQLSTLVKGQTSLDQSFLIQNLSSLESAGPEDIAIILDRGDASVFDGPTKEKIMRSQAGVIIAKDAVVPGKPYLLVDDPLHALVQLTQFAQQKQGSTEQGSISSLATIAPDVSLGEAVSVGPYAVIEKGASIGSYVSIGAHTFIGAHARIGDSVMLHPHVTVAHGCSVGAQSILHSGVVIGGDGFGYQVTQTGLRKIPQVGSVRIGGHVEIGAGSCVDRATFDETVIEDGCKLDNMVHVAHNVRIGKATAILAQTGIAGGAAIGAGCQIGGQVAIKDHITIGDNVRIVSKSAVLKDVPAGHTICGQPAIGFRQWKRQHVALKTFFEKLEQGKKQWPRGWAFVGKVWHGMMRLVRWPRR